MKIKQYVKHTFKTLAVGKSELTRPKFNTKMSICENIRNAVQLGSVGGTAALTQISWIICVSGGTSRR